MAIVQNRTVPILLLFSLAHLGRFSWAEEGNLGALSPHSKIHSSKKSNRIGEDLDLLAQVGTLFIELQRRIRELDVGSLIERLAADAQKGNTPTPTEIQGNFEFAYSAKRFDDQREAFVELLARYLYNAILYHEPLRQFYSGDYDRSKGEKVLWHLNEFIRENDLLVTELVNKLDMMRTSQRPKQMIYAEVTRMLWEGYAHIERNQLDIAEPLLMKALLWTPLAREPRKDLGRLYLKRNKGDDAKKAIDILEGALLFSSLTRLDKAIIYNQLGRLYNGRKGVAKAQDAFENALQFTVAENHKAMLLNKLSKIYKSQGLYGKAIEALDRVTKMPGATDESRAVAYNQLGICYSEQNELTKARDAFEEALGLTVDERYRVILLIKISKIYKAQGLPRKAIEVLERVTKLSGVTDESKAVVYTMLGDIYVQQKEWDRAIDCLKKVHMLKLEAKQHAITLNKLVNEIYIPLRRWDEADTASRLVLELPVDPHQKKIARDNLKTINERRTSSKARLALEGSL